MEEWLARDEGDPGHQMLSEDQIIAQVQEEENDDDSDEDEETGPLAPSLAHVRQCCDSILQYIEITNHPHYLLLYSHFREFRNSIAQLQYQGRQTKIDSFFRPRSRLEPEEAVVVDIPVSSPAP